MSSFIFAGRLTDLFYPISAQRKLATIDKIFKKQVSYPAMLPVLLVLPGGEQVRQVGIILFSTIRLTKVGKILNCGTPNNNTQNGMVHL